MEVEPSPNSSEMPINFHEALCQIETIIGASASAIISAPEFNMSKLRDLLSCLNKIELGPFSAKEHRKTILAIHRLVAKSATKVFEQIIPNYRIKQGDEKADEKVQLSKDVMRLRQYERTFSSTYKNYYLDYLKRMLESVKKNPSSTFYTHLIGADLSDRESLAETAVECYGRILVAHPHFNYRDQIISNLVEFNAQTKHEVCAELAHQHLAKALRHDRLGEVSLEIVTRICELAKKRKLSISSSLIRTMLNLQLIDVKTASAEEKASKKAVAEKLAAMKKQQSRKERKRMKKMKKLSNELLETEAHVSNDQKLKYHKTILKRMFVTYFRLLRYHEDLDSEKKETEKFVKLLPPVLEGVAKFAHLIDLELCNDMFPLINRLLVNRNVGTNCKLHCLSTVFTMYKSLESELNNVDPGNFYKHLYVILTNLDASALNEQEFQSLRNCIELMLIKRSKHVTDKRFFAFVRRLLILTLTVETPQIASNLLDLVKTLFLRRDSITALLDSSNCADFGSGQYDMECEDPDYCHADSSVAWELHMLRNHQNSFIRESTLNFLKEVID